MSSPSCSCRSTTTAPRHPGSRARLRAHARRGKSCRSAPTPPTSSPAAGRAARPARSAPTCSTRTAATAASGCRGKFLRTLKRGDVYRLVQPGGGGYGDPRERDPEAVPEAPAAGQDQRPAPAPLLRPDAGRSRPGRHRRRHLHCERPGTQTRPVGHRPSHRTASSSTFRYRSVMRDESILITSYESLAYRLSQSWGHRITHLLLPIIEWPLELISITK